MVLDWGVRPNRAELPVLPLALAVFFVAFAIMVGSAVWLVSSLQLPSFLLLSELSRRQRWLRYLIYGIGGGFLIYLTNSALYLTTETAEFRPAQVYNFGPSCACRRDDVSVVCNTVSSFRRNAILWLAATVQVQAARMGGPCGGCSSTTNDGAGGHARRSLIVWDGP